MTETTKTTPFSTIYPSFTIHALLISKTYWLSQRKMRYVMIKPIQEAVNSCISVHDHRSRKRIIKNGNQKADDMFALIASPNSQHFSRLAPSIRMNEPHGHQLNPKNKEIVINLFFG
ncbi:hypothetical protein CWS02_16105 [Enterobacter sp. EA-1]|nr:hypothetical protein CWS02_16105 [Enterobacter sp. EA-1]